MVGDLIEKKNEKVMLPIIGIFYLLLSSFKLLIIISTILIILYAASRTVGVPVIGVEFYIGKYDMITKVLQGVIIAISGYLIYKIKTGNKQEEIITKT